MDFLIRLDCPYCRGVVKNQLKEIVPGNSCECPSCHKRMTLTKEDVDRAVNYLENSLRKHPVRR